MSHSIRLRFVDWLHRIANKIGEGVPEALRHDQAHPEPVGKQDFPPVVSILGRASERKIDDAAIVAVFRHHVDECRDDAGILDVNFATKQALAACHNRPDLIAHNAIPKFENLKPAPFFMDCDGIVRPLFCEVQPARKEQEGAS